MNIIDNKIKEYEILRSEINQKIELHNTLLTFTITTVVAILSFILLQEHSYSAFLFLIPFCVLIPMSMRIAYYRSAMAKIAAYMIVFLESDIPGLQWETLNKEVISIAYDKNNEDEDTNESLSSSIHFAERKEVQRLISKRYYECFILGILCYILYAVHYYQNDVCCFLKLFNLLWPLLLILLEFFITVVLDSVDKSKKFWYKQWTKLKRQMEENNTSSIDSDNIIQQH